MSGNAVMMKSFDERQKALKGQELSEQIYTILNRLGQPPTGAELQQIQKLITAGANLEERFNAGKDETLLDLAITREYTDAALLLVRNGADINARCVQDITPFIWAAMKGNIAVLKAMFDTGNAPPPDRDAYDSLGQMKTALMCAAETNKTDCALELIHRGANAFYKNNEGRSAIDLAEAKGHATLIQKMTEACAQREVDALRQGTRNPVTPMRPIALRKGPG